MHATQTHTVYIFWMDSNQIQLCWSPSENLTSKKRMNFGQMSAGMITSRNPSRSDQILIKFMSFESHISDGLQKRWIWLEPSSLEP
jgi:hypothetical protein